MTALLLATTLGVAGQANAGTLFTLGSSLVIDGSNNAGSGVFGTIDPVNDLSGSILLSSGNVNFATVDVFIVDITLTAGSASVGGVDIGVSPGGFTEPVGAGAMDDLGLQGPSSVVHIPLDPIFFTGGVGSFTFSPNQIDAGETTVRLFVTYTEGLISFDDGVNFMISSGSDFTVSATIPEPSTLLLFGAGLLGIGFPSRRSRARLGKPRLRFSTEGT